MSADETRETERDSLIGGELAGRYRVIERIGAGAMGAVYRGEQIEIGLKVAIKVIQQAGDDDEMLASRFRREAKVIASLRHPNTLKLIDFGRLPDGRQYLVTELLCGQPLNAVIRANRCLPVRRTLEIVRQVCLSLQEAHARDITHRDLKPANLFVEDVAGQEFVKVLDFGLAKVTTARAAAGWNPGSRDTMVGTVVGTPTYMAPEQSTGAEIDGRADIYSLGVVAFECLAGYPPFSGEVMEVLLAHHTQLAPALDRIPGLSVPGPVAELVAQMMAKTRDERPPTVAAVRHRIAALLAAESDATKVAETADGRVDIERTPTLRAQHRDRRKFVLALAVAAGGAAVVAVLASSRAPPPAPIVPPPGFLDVPIWTDR